MADNVVKNFILPLQDQFGSLSLDKVDINQLTQYELMKQLIENQNRIELLPSIARDEGYKFPFIDYLDSSGDNSPESTSEMINYFVSKNLEETLLDIKNIDISALVAKVQFFRCPRVNNVIDYANKQLIPFSTYYDPKSFDYFNTDTSTTAAGLQSIDIDILSDTGAFYKYKIVMKIYFANANNLQTNDDYRILLTTPTVDASLNPVSYLLKFGWSPTSSALHDDALGSGKLEFLCKWKAFLILSLQNYELNLNQDGSVVLTVNFFGAAEQESDSSQSDVLEGAFEKQNSLAKIKEDIAAQKKIVSEQITNFKKQQTDAIVKIQKLKAQLQEEQDPQKIKQFKEEIDANMKFTDLDPTQPAANNTIHPLSAYVEGIYNFYGSIRDATDQLASLQNELEERKYVSFMNNLFALHRVYHGALTFFATKNGNSGIQFRTGDLVDDDEEHSKYVQNTFSDGPMLGDIVKRSQKIQEKKASQLSEFEQELIESYITQKKTKKEDIEKKMNATTSDDERVDYANLYFMYTFVGDIVASAYLNAASNFVFDNNSDKSSFDTNKFFSVFLGSLDLERQKVRYDPESVEKKILYRTGDPERISLDLAYFPIPINVFSAWFLRNVVDKRKQNYPFNEFIKDFLNDCVLPAISSYANWDSKFESQFSKGVFEKQKYNMIKTFNDETIETTYVELPYLLSSVAGTTAGAGGFSIHNPIKPSRIKEAFLNDEISAFVEDNDNSYTVNKCLFTYGRFGHAQQSGDVLDNLENGIYHFFAGANTGILKDIKFNPVTSQSQKDAQIDNATSDKGAALNNKFSVTQRYDVNINCIGFQIFKPGQLIYVDTSLLGFGKSTDTTSFSYTYNLGGYYILTKVSHRIEGNDFSTSITGKFIGYGKGLK